MEPRSRADCLCLTGSASGVAEKGCLEIHPCAFLARLYLLLRKRVYRAPETRDVAPQMEDHVAQQAAGPRRPAYRRKWRRRLSLGVARALPRAGEHAGEFFRYIAEHGADDHRKDDDDDRVGH